MPSRSGSWFLRASVSAFAAAVGLSWSASTFATITITPVAPRIFYNNYLYFYHWYPGFTATQPLMDTGFTYYDFRQSLFGFDTAPTDSNAANMIQFDVYSDQTFAPSGDQRVVITILSGSTPVPIATCPLDPAETTICQARNSSIVNFGRFGLAALYQNGATQRVGLYLQDVCAAIGAQNGSIPTGCGAASGTSNYAKFREPASGNVSSFTFTVVVSVVADSTKTGTTSDSEKKDFTLVVESATAALSSCPDTSNIYFPGDGQITLDPGVFSDAFSAARPGGNAPLDDIIVVGQDGATPDTSSSFVNNPIFARLAIGGGSQTVGGFTNTDNATDHKHNLAFAARDYAGAVTPFITGCLDGVQTADIQGFLSQSKCFIATAAFRSGEAPPVSMLRQFRDRILLKNVAGRAMVKWYYSWSPAKADWLIRHPVFRIPVLHVLVPVQLAAWLLLNPFYLVLLLIPAVFLLLGVALRSRLLRHLVVVIPLVFFASAFFIPVLAQADVNQSYIDQLKAGLSQKEEKGSYIEEVKKKLKPEQNQGSYIEEMKSTDPELEKKANRGSYIEEQKARLKAKEDTSAIGAFKEGRSELKAKREGEIHNGVAVKIGASITRNITSGSQMKSFSDVYGDKWVPSVMLVYEYQPWHSEWFGNIGLVLGIGTEVHSGHGIFKVNLINPQTNQPFGTTSRTSFQFYTIPLQAGLNYRFNLLRVLRPYAQVAPTVVGYVERRDDDRGNKYGDSRGVMFSGGVNVLIDWLDPNATWSLYESQGVKHYYLTLDYSRLTTVSGDVNFSISGFSAGFTYEF